MAGCHSFCLFSNFITYIHSFNHNTFIRRHSLSLSPFLHRFVSSVGKTSLWCRAENRTRACLTASRRVANWATPHHNFLHQSSIIKKSQNSRNQGFSSYFCLLMYRYQVWIRIQSRIRIRTNKLRIRIRIQEGQKHRVQFRIRIRNTAATPQTN